MKHYYTRAEAVSSHDLASEIPEISLNDEQRMSVAL